jgi:hypothetical protein
MAGMNSYNHSKLMRPTRSKYATNAFSWQFGQEVGLDILPPAARKSCTESCELRAVRVERGDNILTFTRGTREWVTYWGDNAHRLQTPGFLPNLLLVSGVGNMASMALWDKRWWVFYGVKYLLRPEADARFNYYGRKPRVRYASVYALHNVLDPTWVPAEMDAFEQQCAQLLTTIAGG